MNPYPIRDDNSVLRPADRNATADSHDISALDATRYEFNSPLPMNERTQIHDRSGKAIAESDETPSNASGGRSILASLDFRNQEHIDAVVTQARRTANPSDTVILFNVLSESGGSAAGARSRADERVKSMSELASAFPEGVRVLTHVVHGRPEDTLLGVAEKHKVDLIILGRRKLRGIRKLTTTSVSDHVISAAPCSVLIAKSS